MTGLTHWVRSGQSDDRLLPRHKGETLAIGILTAVLCFVAVIACALGLAGGRLAEAWGGPLAETATLQIVADAPVMETEARAALDLLRQTPGVRGVRMVELEEQRALLEPWIGPAAGVEDLPLPLMIEVRTDPLRLDVAALRDRLLAVAPHASFDDHGVLRSELVFSARALQVFGFGTLAVLAIAQIAAFVLQARASVFRSGETLRTLRLVGARDGYISRRFARRSLDPAIRAAATGGIAALALLNILPAAQEQGFYLVAVAPAGWTWLLLLLVPLSAIALSWIATILTSRRMLRRWT